MTAAWTWARRWSGCAWRCPWQRQAILHCCPMAKRAAASCREWQGALTGWLGLLLRPFRAALKPCCNLLHAWCFYALLHD